MGLENHPYRTEHSEGLVLQIRPFLATPTPQTRLWQLPAPAPQSSGPLSPQGWGQVGRGQWAHAAWGWSSCPGRAPAGDPLRGGLACPGCGCQDRAQLAVPGPALWGNRIPWRNQRAVSESAFLPCVSDPRLCLWAWRQWGFRLWVYLGVT